MKQYWNNLNKPSLFKRLLFVFLSITCSAFGVSCYYACGLGADPISVFVDGQHAILGLTYGQVTTINNVVLVALMFIFARRYFHIGTIVSCFLTGPLIDLFEGMISNAFPAETSALGIKIAILAVGVLTMALGVAFFITVDLGVGAFDFPPLKLRDATRLELRWTRMIFDAIYVVIGFLMGGVVGVGTIVGVLLTGPVMSFFMKRIKQPLDRFFGPLQKA